MAFETPTIFEYKDKELGDTKSIVVATNQNVFYPTSTTALLLNTVRKFETNPPMSVLDLGCGCGIVAIALSEFMPSTSSFFASDIGEEAVELTKKNAKNHGVAIDCRRGSIFEPWVGMEFDLIVDDVSGIAEPIARASRWYPHQIPSAAGRDGTRWIVEILSQAAEFLQPQGRIVFPVVTLSGENKILESARQAFRTVKLLQEQWYPISGELLPRLELLQELVHEGIIEIQQRGSRWWWATKIYLATNAA